MNISVIMASYNGEKYILEQINSIINQLKDTDELIISDDISTDNTLNIVSKFKNKNIKVVQGKQSGVADNFMNALSHAKNEIILFSDQDDIWLDGKLEKVRSFFVDHNETQVVMHNAGYIDERGKIKSSDIFTDRKARHGFIRSIIYSTYYGCCMGVRKKYLKTLMPIPNYVMYDQYIGMCSEMDKSSNFIDEILIYHRHHTGNWSRKQTILQQVFIRIKLLYAAVRRG